MSETPLLTGAQMILDAVILDMERRVKALETTANESADNQRKYQEALAVLGQLKGDRQ